MKKKKNPEEIPVFFFQVKNRDRLDRAFFFFSIFVVDSTDYLTKLVHIALCFESIGNSSPY